MTDYIHELRLKVRDYECDLQGIVNNANYQHYLEHARHEFLLERGVSFAQLHDEGTDAVVANVNLRYKNALRSGEEFVVKTAVKHDGFRYIFYQDIYRLPDMKLCIKGQVDTVVVVNGKLSNADIL